MASAPMSERLRGVVVSEGDYSKEAVDLLVHYLQKAIDNGGSLPVDDMVDYHARAKELRALGENVPFIKEWPDGWLDQDRAKDDDNQKPPPFGGDVASLKDDNKETLLSPASSHKTVDDHTSPVEVAAETKDEAVDGAKKKPADPPADPTSLDQGTPVPAGGAEGEDPKDVVVENNNKNSKKPDPPSGTKDRRLPGSGVVRTDLDAQPAAVDGPIKPSKTADGLTKTPKRQVQRREPVSSSNSSIPARVHRPGYTQAHELLWDSTPQTNEYHPFLPPDLAEVKAKLVKKATLEGLLLAQGKPDLTQRIDHAQENNGKLYKFPLLAGGADRTYADVQKYFEDLLIYLPRSDNWSAKEYSVESPLPDTKYLYARGKPVLSLGETIYVAKNYYSHLLHDARRLREAMSENFIVPSTTTLKFARFRVDHKGVHYMIDDAEGDLVPVNGDGPRIERTHAQFTFDFSDLDLLVKAVLPQEDDQAQAAAVREADVQESDDEPEEQKMPAKDSDDEIFYDAHDEPDEDEDLPFDCNQARGVAHKSSSTASDEEEEQSNLPVDPFQDAYEPDEEEEEEDFPFDPSQARGVARRPSYTASDEEEGQFDLGVAVGAIQSIMSGVREISTAREGNIASMDQRIGADNQQLLANRKLALENQKKALENDKKSLDDTKETEDAILSQNGQVLQARLAYDQEMKESAKKLVDSAEALALAAQRRSAAPQPRNLFAADSSARQSASATDTPIRRGKTTTSGRKKATTSQSGTTPRTTPSGSSRPPMCPNSKPSATRKTKKTPTVPAASKRNSPVTEPAAASTVAKRSPAPKKRASSATPKKPSVAPKKGASPSTATTETPKSTVAKRSPAPKVKSATPKKSVAKKKSSEEEVLAADAAAARKAPKKGAFRDKNIASSRDLREDTSQPKETTTPGATSATKKTPAKRKKSATVEDNTESTGLRRSNRRRTTRKL